MGVGVFKQNLLPTCRWESPFDIALCRERDGEIRGLAAHIYSILNERHDRMRCLGLAPIAESPRIFFRALSGQRSVFSFRSERGTSSWVLTPSGLRVDIWGVGDIFEGSRPTYIHYAGVGVPNDGDFLRFYGAIVTRYPIPFSDGEPGFVDEEAAVGLFSEVVNELELSGTATMPLSSTFKRKRYVS